MSDLSEAIEAERERRSRRTGRMTSKARRAQRRGPSKPGGFSIACGCRFCRTGDAWRHIWACRDHKLSGPLTDAEMKFLLEDS